MFKMIYSLLISLLVLNVLYAQDQTDPTFCDINTIPEDPEKLPIPIQSNPFAQYRAEIEKNNGQLGATEEIREIFDGQKNFGITRNRLFGARLETYSDFNKDELLIIDGPSCQVKKLSQSIRDTEFFSVSINGTLHIVSGLGLLLRTGQKFVYTGTGYSRGISVRKWQTCLYDQNKNATVRLTFEFAYDWIPAVDTDKNYTIPVAIIADYKNRYTSQEYSIHNSITRFRHGLDLNEESYETPDGIYCEGRSSSKVPPSLPKSFSYWTRIARTNVGSNGESGTMHTIRNEVDVDKKLHRFDYYVDDARVTEIQDLNTGLRYRIHHFNDTCKVDSLNDRELNEEFSPVHMLHLDGTPAPQYVGTKRTRSIRTDVWIAPRQFRGNNTVWEWHFSTDSWAIQEQNSARRNEPILVSVYNLVDVPNNFTVIPELKLVPTYFHIADFDATKIDLYDFDISSCEHHDEKKYVRFSITNDKYDLLKANEAELKEKLINAIQTITKVSFIRISKLETVFDDGTVYVTFTLFDRPKFTAIPTAPVESSLREALKSLEDTFSSNRFTFSINVSNSDNVYNVYSMQADKDSLKELDRRDGRYVYLKTESGKTIGYTGGSVAGFIIGFLIVGLVAGFASGYFIIIKKSVNLPGPLSFFNPNFKSDA